MQTSFLNTLRGNHRAVILGAVFVTLLSIATLTSHSTAQEASTTTNIPTITFHQPSGHISVVGTSSADRVSAAVREYKLRVSAAVVGGQSVSKEFPLGQVETIKIVTMEGDDIIDLFGEYWDQYEEPANIPAEVFAGPGNDSVFGGKKNDTLNGGAGDDWIEGHQGYDVLRGDNGNDVLIGDEQSDSLDGGNGDDICADAKSGSCETNVTTQ